MAKIRPMMILPPLIFAAFAALLVFAMLRGHDDTLPTTLAGQSAPDLPETGLGDLPRFTARDLADGQVKLVNFWASWCAPCRVEHPNLAQLAADGLPIYGINYKDQQGNAVAFLQELGNPYEGVLSDPTGKRALDWGVYGVPETYVIDGQGRIVDRIAGPVTQRVIAGQLREALDTARMSSQ